MATASQNVTHQSTWSLGNQSHNDSNRVPISEAARPFYCKNNKKSKSKGIELKQIAPKFISH